MNTSTPIQEVVSATPVTLPEVVYSPESPIRHPGRLIAAMWQDLLASRELAWRLFVRDVSAMYRQSFFGYLWAFVPPVLAALPWVFLNSQNIVNVGHTPIAYPAFVMTGMMLWQSFLDALNSPLKQTNAARSMLAKLNFPREALLLAGLAESVWNLAIRMVLLVPILWLYGSWTFSSGNFRDLDAFLVRLRTQESAVSAHLWSRLSDATQARIAAQVDGAPAANDLNASVVREMNAILHGGPLYNEARFSGVVLSAETQKLLAKSSGGSDLARLNRSLLEDAFPNELMSYEPVRALAWAPVGIGGVMILGLALGLLITPMGLLYTDVARAIGVVAGFGMLLTPIVYPPRTTGLAGWLSNWNPCSPVLVTARDWLTGQPAQFVTGFWWVTAGSLIVFLIAWFIYRLTMPIIVERMGG